MNDFKEALRQTGLSRRDFLLASAATGAGAALGGAAFAQPAEQPAAEVELPAKSDDLNIAMIGLGAQGQVLLESITNIPSIRIKAICDIWEYSRQVVAGRLKKYGVEVATYIDYQDMLEKEAGQLDAVVIATPDWMHAEHAIACMRAGLHVYCEKEMSNDLWKARQMALTARETGKLLQIGHQRRSNPRYLHAIQKLIFDNNLLGQITHANAQWNRAKSEDLGWDAKFEIPAETLNRYGYASMQQFRNWRWYKKYGGGPIVDLGSHQIDIFTWIFGANPSAVTASGGVDFYRHHEWFDNVMAIFDYDTPTGSKRAFYQVLTTTAYGLFYEAFMGIDGALVISEVPESGNHVLREAHAPSWDKFVRQGLLVKTAPPAVKATKDTLVDVRASKPLGSWPLPVDMAKPAHQPHLENFFNAIRYGVPLNCPAEIGYETAVAVLRVNEAVEAGRKLYFQPEDFEV